MPRKDVAIRVEGLAELRRDLKAVDRKLLREFQKEMKEAAGIVALDARRRAPKRTGALAASIKPGTSGNRAVIRSNLPYANPIHWGWPARGIPRRPFIQDALEANQDRFLNRLGDNVERLFERHGFNK